MSDNTSGNMRAPVGKPMNDEGEGAEDEAQEVDERISDDPVVEEEDEDDEDSGDDVSYDPAVQAPAEAER